MLIPNLNLETPHYTVTRLRADDLTADTQLASYKLVSSQEESKNANTTQGTKPQPVRALAVVQGITPDQPAPMRAVKVEAAPLSIFSKLFGWLIPSTDTAASARPQTATSPREQHRPHREPRIEGQGGEGGRSESSRDNNRQRNKPRRPREEAAPRTDQQHDRPAQSTAKANEPRIDRPPRPAQAKQERTVPQHKAVASNASPTLTNQNELAPADLALENLPPDTADPAHLPQGKSSTASVLLAASGAMPGESAAHGGRKRGRRSGQRVRGRRSQQATAQTAYEEMPGKETGSDSNGRRAHELPDDTELPEASTSMEDSAANTVPLTPNVSNVMITNTVAPFIENDHATNLVQIETSPEKLASSTPPKEASSPHGSRRRSRPREVYTAEDNEPLVQIETQSPNQQP